MTNPAVEAHRRYVSVGKLCPELLREPVFRAWERSHVSGASARRLKAVVLEANETERLLSAEEPLIRAAKPYMRALSQAAGEDHHYAAMLGDSRAVVLDVVGHEQNARGPEGVPVPGSLLAESVSGANGIGSPLAEGGYVEIIGPEHFVEGFHLFTCQGIPLRDPDGAVVGVICVSGRRPQMVQRLREILVCAARGMEVELLRSRIEEDVKRVVATGELDEALLEKLRQDLVQSQAAARLEVELAAKSLGRSRPVEYATKLLSLAQRSMDSFQRQGALWRDLVSRARGASCVIDLDARLAVLAELLKTEAATSGITIEIEQADEGISVLADPQKLSRDLFRAFLFAFDAAQGGGLVRARARRGADEQAEVRFTAEPSSSGPPAVFLVKLPVSSSAPRVGS